MALGPRDLSTLVTLPGWDPAEIRRFELEDGTSYATVVSQVSAALGAVTAEIINDPLYSSLVSYTDRPEVEYRQGGGSDMEEHTEYGRPDVERGDTTGHMLPFKKFDKALGWTWDYLREARLPQIQADIADGVQAVRNRYHKAFLSRLFKRADDSGAALGLGTSGYSPGFATAAANTNVDFIPVPYGGISFTSAHEHYVAAAGGWTVDILKDIKAELREHGHQPPYNLIVSPLDEAAITALTGFIPTARMLVNYGSQTALATFSSDEISPGIYSIGTLEDIRVWVVPGVPQYYGFAWKTYGANSQLNPLRVRVRKGQTRPTVFAMTDPRAGNATNPLQYLMFFSEFGVGVGADRTNGTPRYVNNAAWSDGVVT
jgi:hypothetical protein